MQSLFRVLLLMAALSTLEAANILAVLPLKVHSHFALSEAILAALANRGHQVVVYSPFAPKPNPNIKHIDVQTKQRPDKLADSFEQFLERVNPRTYFGLMGPHPFWSLGYIMCENVMAHPKIKELLDTKQTFDLVLTEALFGQESMLLFGHKFSAPTVNINSFGLWSVLNRVAGNEMLTSHAPEIPPLPYPPHMTFLQRVQNTLSVASTLLQYHYQHLPKHQQVLDKLLGDKAPSVVDLVNSISLHLINNHPNIVPLPMPPSQVPIGGIHLQDKLEPLPKDIQEFMDSGKKAIIYFSLGSVVPTDLMPPELIQTFVKVFTKLPYKVLWKTDAQTIPNLPQNVKVVKWVPQQTVLAHPNLVLFITHGGLLSQLEALHAGVPVVGIPFFGDQPYNVGVYESLGVGRGLRLADLNEKTMTETILSVVGKPNFISSAKKISDVFRHRPMSPGDTAVFWVEHVLRHKGAHLTPYARNLSFVTLQGLDVWAALSGVVLSVMWLVWFIISLLCCRKSKQQPPSKNKKKTN